MGSINKKGPPGFQDGQYERREAIALYISVNKCVCGYERLWSQIDLEDTQ